jgi:hypothetical protein
MVLMHVIRRRRRTEHRLRWVALLPALRVLLLRLIASELDDLRDAIKVRIVVDGFSSIGKRCRVA